MAVIPIIVDRLRFRRPGRTGTLLPKSFE